MEPSLPSLNRPLNIAGVRAEPLATVRYGPYRLSLDPDGTLSLTVSVSEDSLRQRSNYFHLLGETSKTNVEVGAIIAPELKRLDRTEVRKTLTDRFKRKLTKVDFDDANVITARVDRHVIRFLKLTFSKRCFDGHLGVDLELRVELQPSKRQIVGTSSAAIHRELVAKTWEELKKAYEDERSLSGMARIGSIKLARVADYMDKFYEINRARTSGAMIHELSAHSRLF